MKNSNLLHPLLYLLVTLNLFSSTIIGQHKSDGYAGIWTNVVDSGFSMIIYPDGKDAVIVHSKRYYLDEWEMKIEWELKTGMTLKKDSLMSTSGPYQIYGMEGYFLKDKGKNYYFDWFYSQMGAADSLEALYVKTAELPENWSLSMDDRIGETGILNKKERYILTRIDYLQKRADENSTNLYWVFYFGEDLEFRIPAAQISDYPYLDSLIQTKGNDPKNLIGEYVKLIYTFDGYNPGHCFIEEKTGFFQAAGCIPIRVEAISTLSN